MTGPFPFGAVPGFRTTVESEESGFTRGGRNGETMITQLPYVIDSAAVDDLDTLNAAIVANSPTTTLRGGSIMTIPQGATELLPYRTSRAGRIVGVLPRAYSTLIDNTATDKWTGLFTSGFLRASEIPNLDYYAASSLFSAGFLFDNPAYNVPFAGINRTRSVTASTTVVAADHGTRFMALTASLVFTLPTIKKGLSFQFFGGTTTAGSVIGPSADLIISDASTATASTNATSVSSLDKLVTVFADYIASEQTALVWIATTQTIPAVLA